mgnify:CR=1 FL=1
MTEDKNLKVCVFDIEANELHKPDKIWVMSAAIFSNGKWRMKSTSNYDEMRAFFLSADKLIGHNIILWDIPHIERILDIKIEAELIDTLGFSWYLEPYRMRHGLEFYGNDFGIPKPKIDENEWAGKLPNETQQEFDDKMAHRCEEDVKINCQLIDKQWRDLKNLYDDDHVSIERIAKYLMFKMRCARAQEASRWRLDIDLCTQTLEKLEAEKELKVGELRVAMPKVSKMGEMWKPDSLYKKPKLVKKPKTFQKSSGDLSAAGVRYKAICDSVGEDAYKKDSITIQSKELTAQGIKWMNLVEANNLPESHEDPLEYLVSEKEPNPNSTAQVKDWLYDNGWIPETFSFKRDSEGNAKQVPQVRTEIKGEKVLCKSVVKLIEKVPALEALRGLSVLSHRIPILKGFLKNADEDGYIKAEIQGLTNTLRFKHRIVVNLPSVGKPYGEEVRGCLIAPEGYELCGSDMSSLEDRTKMHYMWEFDPEYVKQMMSPDFDSHLDLAVVAGFLTQEQADSHKRYGKYKNEYKNAVADARLGDADKFKALYEVEQDYSFERAMSKTANYACVYGAGGATVARGADISKAEGEKLVEKYWERNWAVKKVAEVQKVKRCLDSSWLFNPVSKMWYSLRSDKDRFSTLNQGTGVFCFDVWIKNFMDARDQLTGQMHDEVILTVKKGHRGEVEKLLKDAIQLTNKQLKLNRDLDVDVQFGDSYAEIH